MIQRIPAQQAFLEELLENLNVETSPFDMSVDTNVSSFNNGLRNSYVMEEAIDSVFIENKNSNSYCLKIIIIILLIYILYKCIMKGKEYFINNHKDNNLKEDNNDKYDNYLKSHFINFDN